MACQEGHHYVVKILLGAGAVVDIATSDVSDILLLHPMYTVHTEVVILKTNHSAILV